MRTTTARALAILGTTLALGACDSGGAASAPPLAPTSTTPMTPEIAARVSGIDVDAAHVGEIAAVQRMTPAAARDLAVRDALFAAEARARGMDRGAEVEAARDALLASAMIRELLREAEAQGPVTDEELAAVTAERWMELDRPDAVAVIHVLIHADEKASEEQKTKAKEVSEAMRGALDEAAEIAARTEAPERGKNGPPDAAAAAFRAATSAVPAKGLKLTVEELAPVVSDGRAFDGNQYEAPFAAAAAALERRGAVSPVVRTTYGFHVMMALQRVPGKRVPIEERRTRVREEVITARAHAAKERIVGAGQNVKLPSNVDGLMQLVPVEEPERTAGAVEP